MEKPNKITRYCEINYSIWYSALTCSTEFIRSIIQILIPATHIIVMRMDKIAHYLFESAHSSIDLQPCTMIPANVFLMNVF